MNKVGDQLFDSGYQNNEPHTRATAMGREALVYTEELYDRKSVHTAKSLILVARGLYANSMVNSHNNSDEVIEIAQEALDIFLSIYGGREYEDVAMSLYTIACALSGKGEYDEALKMFREAISIQEKLFGKESTKVQNTKWNMELTSIKKKEYESACETKKETS